MMLQQNIHKPHTHLRGPWLDIELLCPLHNLFIIIFICSMFSIFVAHDNYVVSYNFCDVASITIHVHEKIASYSG